MLSEFRPIKAFLKTDRVWIDNHVFRLHYKVSVILFMSASLMVSSKQFFGSSIECVFDGMNTLLLIGPMVHIKRSLETYCWIHSTFSIPTRFDQGGSKEEGLFFAQPGVAPMADLGQNASRKYHKYYQWVSLVLFFQACAFYLPRYLWKTTEGGKIRTMVQGLMEPLIKKEARAEQIDTMVKYFRLHRGTHALYALKYFACEAMNLVNVVLQMYLLDAFLGHEFTTYGINVVKYSEMDSLDRRDPMRTIFPKVTKCTFHKYGPGGTVENKDGICVLPLNVLNEKIFIIVWFWLVILGSITSACLLYRLVVLLSPTIRISLVACKGGKSTKYADVEVALEPNSSGALNYLERLGDWLVLYLVCKNLDALKVSEVVRQLRIQDNAFANANAVSEEVVGGEEMQQREPLCQTTSQV